MKDLLGMATVCEVTLDVDLKLGAFMKMLPAKERDVIKLNYFENENALTYDVLRRQGEGELWLESLQTGPVPMGLSTLQSADLSSMTEEQLECALFVLMEKGCKGKKGTKGNNGKAR